MLVGCCVECWEWVVENVDFGLFYEGLSDGEVLLLFVWDVGFVLCDCVVEFVGYLWYEVFGLCDFECGLEFVVGGVWFVVV